MTFNEISNDIINTDKFKSLEEEKHHGLNRYIHVMRVARNTYRISKFFKLDYISATRGALLHDYFNDFEYINSKGLNKANLHPTIALNNSLREFNLNKKEENIIVSHMFPFGSTIPKYKESWLVSIIDKLVATYECILYKPKELFTLYTIVFINIINL